MTTRQYAFFLGKLFAIISSESFEELKRKWLAVDRSLPAIERMHWNYHHHTVRPRETTTTNLTICMTCTRPSYLHPSFSINLTDDYIAASTSQLDRSCPFHAEGSTAHCAWCPMLIGNDSTVFSNYAGTLPISRIVAMVVCERANCFTTPNRFRGKQQLVSALIVVVVGCHTTLAWQMRKIASNQRTCR